jgi:hypothetical protein
VSRRRTTRRRCGLVGDKLLHGGRALGKHNRICTLQWVML